jgi:uncharacterized protein (DUF924 family)
MHDPVATALLETWFGADESQLAAASPRWFRKDPAFDDALRQQFGQYVTPAAAGAFLHWEATPAGALALVVLLDQVPRNIFRGDPRSFSQDAAALAVARRALARAFDVGMPLPKRNFFVMPFMHAEDPAAQAEGLARIEALATDARGGPWAEMGAAGLKFGLMHANIIRRFGRFPHRNPVLGRVSTPEELAFVAEHGGF